MQKIMKGVRATFLVLVMLVPLAGPSQDVTPPSPFTVIENGDRDIPVYRWEEFRKMLNPASDTTYIFNFWATWCKPCVRELPAFEEVSEKYAGEKVKVVLVNLDMKSMWETNLRSFVNDRELKSQVIVLYEVDANIWIDQVDPGWSGAIPATLLVKGGTRMFHEGEMSSEELHAKLEEIRG